MSGGKKSVFDVKTLCIVLMLPVFFSCVFGQKANERAKNWKPEEGKYYFSQAFIWAYYDEFADSKGEIKVYVDTLSGTFLFNNEAYGMSDDAEFILAFQDGIYMSGYTDANGRKTIKTDTLTEIPTMIAGKQYYDADFQRMSKPTGQKRIFGKNNMKWPIIEGECYRTTFDTPGAFSDDYIVKMNFYMLPVYYFNQRQGGARLKYNFSAALPMDYLLLETAYESDGKKIGVNLKNVMPAKLILDISGYEK
jgi:hypothetical protein